MRMSGIEKECWGAKSNSLKPLGGGIKIKSITNKVTSDNSMTTSNHKLSLMTRSKLTSLSTI
jgi:hypothetical protein